MGRLVLRLHHDAARSAHKAGRLLRELRRLKATLTRSTVEGKERPIEIYEFTTVAVPRPKARRRSPCLIRAFADQQDAITRLAAVAQLGRAIVQAPFTGNPRKEVPMSNVSRIRPLALGRFEPEARRLFELARRLVRAEGPPEELRMASSPVTVVPHGHRDLPPRNAWGVAGIGVGLEMQREYPPVEAMVVAGYILFGADWPGTFKNLRLPASLEHAYVALEQHFSDTNRRKPDALVTIPKSITVSQRQPARPIAIADRGDARPALTPPERPQLTHQLTDHAEKSSTQLPATRIP